METYKRQNKIQESLNALFPNWKYANIVRHRGVEFYTPKINKFRLGVFVLLVVGCLITPATNWIIPFLIGWVLR